MENLKIEAVKKEDIPVLVQLADEIWHQHFTPIIGAEQVAYMLERFQSEWAISDAIDREGYRYYFFCYDGERVGYIGIVPKEDGSLFLSKLYLRQAYRGKKIARAGMTFLEMLCRENGWRRIFLTCNRDNGNSVAAYKKMGFVILYEQDAPIGNGFVMNDYVMEKIVEVKE